MNDFFKCIYRDSLFHTKKFLKEKPLSESCHEETTIYLDFHLYQYGINKINSLVESDEVFNAKIQKGYKNDSLNQSLYSV